MNRNLLLSIVLLGLAASPSAKGGPTAENEYGRGYDLQDYGQTRKEQALHAKHISRTPGAHQRHNGREDAIHTPGREYYHDLLDEAAEQHWVVPISFHANIACESFGCDGECQSLAGLIFNDNCVRFRDIFLFSKLSEDNKVRVDNVDARVPNRPQGNPAEFGAFSDDLYPTLLAPVKLDIAAEAREFGANIGLAYRFGVPCLEELTAIVGIDVPLKRCIRIMDLGFVDGILYTPGFTEGGTSRLDSVNQFFARFTDVEDFFKRAILEPKGLTFKERQCKTGVGDISLYSLVDFANYWEWLDGLQIGSNFVLPSGSSGDDRTLWGLGLGDGFFQWNPFITAIFTTPSHYLNPSFRFAAEINFRRNTRRRVPKRRSFAGPRERIANIPDLDLIMPLDQFVQYYVDPFDEFDSTVPAFADQAIETRTKPGSRFLVGVGNYFHNVFDLGFRLGLFYDYMHKRLDDVTICCEDQSDFDVCSLTNCTDQRSHRVGWNLTYKFKNHSEVNIGSEHIIHGRNVPKVHEAFASVVITF